MIVEPGWKNTAIVSQAFTGVASNFVGPLGPGYVVDDNFADYGTVSAGATADCDTATRFP